MDCILKALTLFWTKQITIISVPLHRFHLQGQGEVACFGVPDNAGGHGRLGSPAPLQVTHSVLVQVASHHCCGTGPHATWGELQSPLGSHKAKWYNIDMRFTEKRNTKQPHHTQMDTNQRAVTLRNTFIPNEGPLISPAPNSSLRHTKKQEH